MKRALVKFSTWKFIVPALVAFIVCIYLFQKGQNEMSALAGKEVIMIDMMPQYDKDEISDFFTKIKPEGREIHRHMTAVVDMVFPFAYGALFILLSAFFLKRVVSPDSNWIYISLIPILLMVVDFKENLNTLALLKSYPNLDADMVASASTITSVKSMLTTISMVLPLLLGMIWIIKMVMKKK